MDSSVLISYVLYNMSFLMFFNALRDQFNEIAIGILAISSAGHTREYPNHRNLVVHLLEPGDKILHSRRNRDSLVGGHIERLEDFNA